MTSDRDALLTAIAINPDDDTPRLVYADWLQEHGGASDRARAEFIRLQIERARNPAHSGTGVAERLEADLAREHRAAWEAEALAPVSARFRFAGAPTVEFRRGFVEVLSITIADFMPHAAALFARNPIYDVVLVGHEPAATRGGWTWQVGGPWSGQRAWGGCIIPTALFQRLPGGTAPRGLSFGLREYPTRAVALDALSAAAVSYGIHKFNMLLSRGVD